MSSSYARDKPLPPISRPKRLRRAKSTSTPAQSGSTSRSSSKSRRASHGSGTSGSSQSTSSGRSVMKTIISILNTPIVEPEYRRRSRSSLSEASAMLRNFLRGEDHEENRQAALEPPALRHVKSSSSIRSATTSILSSYCSFRQSILTSADGGPAREKVIAYAGKYYDSLQELKKQIEALPGAVKNTLEVQRMVEHLQFTSDLLEPSVKGEHGQQTIVLLDGTLQIVRNLLVDANRMCRELRNTPTPIVDEDEHDEDEYEFIDAGELGENRATSSKAGEYEYDIPEAHLAILITEPDDEPPRPQRGGLRKMKSSMAVLGGPSLGKDLARDSGYDTREDWHVETARRERLFINRKVRFSGLLDRTYALPRDLAQSVEDVAESLTAINALPLFSGSASSETPKVRPADTVDITYSNEGIPAAMSAAAIIEYLISDLGYQPSKAKCPIENFSDIILTTFRFFWEPEQFLEYLERTYDGTYFNDRKLSVVLLVRLWVLSYWLPQDSQKEGLIAKVQRFLGKALSDGFVWSSILTDLFSRLAYYEEDPECAAIARHVPELQYEPMPFRFIDFSRDMPLLRRNFANIRIMSFNNSIGCMELARQLTLKESALYLCLSAREIITRYVVRDEDNKEASLAREKMDKLKEFSATVYRWAAWHILKRSTPLKRARAFGFMMRLAKYLLTIRNFSSAHSVFNGAMSVHLDILSHTNTEILPKARRNLEDITRFFNENRDISMQSSAQPTVPIMATYAGKLTRLLEAKGIMTPSRVDQSVQLVNISFFRAATRITYAMESNQHPYDFKAHAPLQDFIDYTFKEVPSEDEIHERYLEVKAGELGSAPVFKPSLMHRLRTNSVMALSKF